MDQEREQNIRRRAYAFWVAAGKTEGSSLRFWKEAEAQINIEASVVRETKRRRHKQTDRTKTHAALLRKQRDVSRSLLSKSNTITAGATAYSMSVTKIFRRRSALSKRFRLTQHVDLLVEELDLEFAFALMQ